MSAPKTNSGDDANYHHYNIYVLYHMYDKHWPFLTGIYPYRFVTPSFLNYFQCGVFPMLLYLENFFSCFPIV